ncbi:zinc finger (CCCH type) motif-containing protein [Besnoitia besnoiti]|uniref:Zinc finger (CCCH type) motif-containing protein n=1 Tax=Besnoitia besnoiti TaxID=94643 RepID=A0A2A9M843_BESBE|nr:zinc finger (CCCH type) motif-containing protein [Besnoitia besnoiti]PFH34648.1 zinc finger (CCCH type) motif-containing protein [Besnoitia besnoiti]
MPRLRDGGAMQTATRSHQLIARSLPAACLGASSPGNQDEMEAHAHVQQFQAPGEWARGGTGSEWFSRTTEAEAGVTALGDSKPQPEDATCELPQTGTTHAEHGHYDENSSICSFDATAGLRGAACGLGPSEMPCSSSSTLTTTSTLPPSPIRAPRVACWESVCGQTCSFELSYGSSREAMAADMVPIQHCVQVAQGASSAAELRPSPSLSLTSGAFAAAGQSVSGSRIISENRHVDADQNDPSQLCTGLRDYSSGNVCMAGPDTAPCNFPHLFPPPSSENIICTQDAETSVAMGQPIQPPISSWPGYRGESAVPQLVTGTWGVAAYGELDLGPSGSDWQSVMAGSHFPVSPTTCHQRDNVADHSMPLMRAEASGALNIKAPAGAGSGDPPGGTAPPSSPSTRPGSVCQSHFEPEKVFLAAGLIPSRCSGSVGPSRSDEARAENDSLVELSSDSNRPATERLEAYARQRFDELQTGASSGTSCRLAEQRALSGAATPSQRGRSWSSIQKRETPETGSSYRNGSEPEGVPLTSCADVASPTVSHMDLGADRILGCRASFGQLPPLSSPHYNTRSARLIDVSAGAGRGVFSEKRNGSYGAGVNAWDAFAQDGNCVSNGTGAASDTITEDGETLTCEGTESSPSQTSRNSVFSCPTSVTEGCNGLAETGCMFAAGANGSMTMQAALVTSSNAGAAGGSNLLLPDKTVWHELEERLAVAATAATIRTSCGSTLAPIVPSGSEAGQDAAISSATTILHDMDRRNAAVVAEGSIRGHGPCIIQRTDGSLLRTKGIAPQDPNKRVFRRLMFSKTKICPWFEQGKCLRGDLCNYAHSRGELRVLPVAKKLCLSYLKVGRCSNPHCSFAHSAEEVEDSKKMKQGTPWQWRHFDEAAALWGQGLAPRATAPDTRNSSRLVKTSQITSTRPLRATAGRSVLTPAGSGMRPNESSITGSEGLSSCSTSTALTGCPLQLVNSQCFEPDACDVLRSGETTQYDRVQSSSLSGFMPALDSGDIFPSYWSSGPTKGSNRSNSRSLGATRPGGGRMLERALKRNESRALSDDMLTSQFHSIILDAGSPAARVNDSLYGADSDAAVVVPERSPALGWDRRCGGNAGGVKDASARAYIPVLTSSEAEDESTEHVVQRSSMVDPSTKEDPGSLKSDIVLALLCQQLKNLIGRIYGVEGVLSDLADKGPPAPAVEGKANTVCVDGKRPIDSRRHWVNDSSGENVIDEPQAGGGHRGESSA